MPLDFSTEESKLNTFELIEYWQIEILNISIIPKAARVFLSDLIADYLRLKQMEINRLEALRDSAEARRGTTYQTTKPINKLSRSQQWRRSKKSSQP